MNCGPPGPSTHGILQARILEWGAMSSSGDLPDPGIAPTSLTSPASAGGSQHRFLPPRQFSPGPWLPLLSSLLTVTRLLVAWRSGQANSYLGLCSAVLKCSFQDIFLLHSFTFAPSSLCLNASSSSRPTGTAFNVSACTSWAFSAPTLLNHLPCAILFFLIIYFYFENLKPKEKLKIQCK